MKLIDKNNFDLLTYHIDSIGFKCDSLTNHNNNIKIE